MTDPIAELDALHHRAIERGEATDPIEWTKAVWSEPIRVGSGETATLYVDDITITDDDDPLGEA